MSNVPRVLVDLAGFEQIPLFSRRAPCVPPGSRFARPTDETMTLAAATADSGCRDRAALPTLGRLARERRIEFCSYGEFGPPSEVDACHGTWRELLGDVPVTTIAPAISRAELGTDVFRDLEQSGALLRLCARLKRGEWASTDLGATDAINHDARRIERFRRMTARVQGHHLVDLFHLWSAEQAGCSYWLTADESLADLLRVRVQPFLSPALACQLVRPDGLLNLLGVRERDAVPSVSDRVVSIAAPGARRVSADASVETPWLK